MYQAPKYLEPKVPSVVTVSLRRGGLSMAPLAELRLPWPAARRRAGPRRAGCHGGPRGPGSGWGVFDSTW